MAELLKGHHNSITTPEHGDQNSCSLEHLSHKRFFCHICVLVELSFCSLPYLSPPLHPIFKFCYVYAVVKKSIIPYKSRNHGSVSQLSLQYQMTKNCLQSKTVHVVWPVPILNCTISKKIMHTQANSLMTITFSQHSSLLQELLSEAHLCFV